MKNIKPLIVVIAFLAMAVGCQKEEAPSGRVTFNGPNDGGRLGVNPISNIPPSRPALSQVPPSNSEARTGLPNDNGSVEDAPTTPENPQPPIDAGVTLPEEIEDPCLGPSQSIANDQIPLITYLHPERGNDGQTVSLAAYKKDGSLVLNYEFSKKMEIGPHTYLASNEDINHLPEESAQASTEPTLRIFEICENSRGTLKLEIHIVSQAELLSIKQAAGTGQVLENYMPLIESEFHIHSQRMTHRHSTHSGLSGNLEPIRETVDNLFENREAYVTFSNLIWNDELKDDQTTPSILHKQDIRTELHSADHTPMTIDFIESPEHLGNLVNGTVLFQGLDDTLITTDKSAVLRTRDMMAGVIYPYYLIFDIPVSDAMTITLELSDTDLSGIDFPTIPAFEHLSRDACWGCHHFNYIEEDIKVEGTDETDEVREGVLII